MDGKQICEKMIEMINIIDHRGNTNETLHDECLHDISIASKERQLLSSNECAEQTLWHTAGRN